MTPISRTCLILITVLSVVCKGANYAFANSDTHIPLKEYIDVPLTDLKIQKIEVTGTFLRLGLQNINSFSKPRIYWAKCKSKYAVVSGIQLGKPISTSEKIVISVKKPCNVLKLKLSYRTVNIKLSKQLRQRITYNMDLSDIIDPYLDWNDLTAPKIEFIGNESQKKFIRQGDKFVFQVTDNRRLKQILIDGRQVEQDSSGFVEYKLKSEPFFYTLIDVSAIDINGNITEKEFILHRDYWESFIYYSREDAGLQWAIGLFCFAFIAPLSFGRFKKMQRRKRKRKEIERIRERNEKWHYTREARALKNKYISQRDRASKLSKQLDSQKKLAAKRLQAINELNKRIFHLKNQKSSLQADRAQHKNEIQQLNQKLIYIRRLADTLKGENQKLTKKIKKLQERMKNSKGEPNTIFDFTIPTTRTESKEILGISNQYTISEIKKARKKLTLLYHPDKVQHLGPKLGKVAELEMKRINQAYSLLVD